MDESAAVNSLEESGSVWKRLARGLVVAREQGRGPQDAGERTELRGTVGHTGTETPGDRWAPAAGVRALLLPQLADPGISGSHAGACQQSTSAQTPVSTCAHCLSD